MRDRIDGGDCTHMSCGRPPLSDHSIGRLPAGLSPGGLRGCTAINAVNGGPSVDGQSGRPQQVSSLLIAGPSDDLDLPRGSSHPDYCDCVC